MNAIYLLNKLIDTNPPHEIKISLQKVRDLLEWKPISTAPRDGTFVELRGDSGMRGYPSRVMIARYEPNRADPERIINTDHGDEWAWRTVAGDHVTDDGAFPTHWRPVS